MKRGLKETDHHPLHDSRKEPSVSTTEGGGEEWKRMHEKRKKPVKYGNSGSKVCHPLQIVYNILLVSYLNPSVDQKRARRERKRDMTMQLFLTQFS